MPYCVVKSTEISNSQLGSFLLDLLALILVITVCLLAFVALIKPTSYLSTVSKYGVLKVPWVEHS